MGFGNLAVRIVQGMTDLFACLCVCVCVCVCACFVSLSECAAPARVENSNKQVVGFWSIRVMQPLQSDICIKLGN